MKKILILLALVIVFGVANVALAVEEVEEPANVEAEQEEIIEEESEAVEEEGCSHSFGEWYYNVSVTYYRSCECGAYEEMDEETFYDLGGIYANCDMGRHYWIEDDGTLWCEECGYTTEALQGTQ